MISTKKFIKSSTYTLIWITIVFIISLVDWYEHITREQQLFRLNPWKWLLFTFTSTVLLLFTAITFSLLLRSVIRIRFVRELLSALAGMMSFLLFGNYIGQMIVREISLHFPFNLSIIALSLFIFTIIWVIINSIVSVKPQPDLQEHV